MKSRLRPPAPRRFRAALAVFALAGLSSGVARADVTPPDTVVLGDIKYATGPHFVAIEPWMTQTGWDIREIIFAYNTKTDTLDVDVKTTGIAGDADGLGIPGQFDPQLIAAGGVNPANIGGRGSISFGFWSANANGTMGAAVAVAGVPEVKPDNAPQDGFRLAQFDPTKSLPTSYGASITNATGTLLYSPSAQHPDFEFTISNFSKLFGMNLANGFYFAGFAGSPDDRVAGEDHIAATFIPGFNPQPQFFIPNSDFFPNPPPPPTPSVGPQFPVPEPSGLALAGVGGLGLWLGSRRRRRPA